MAASDKHLGRARCPLCNGDKATLGVSGKGWPYLVMPCCKAQLFARGHESDALMRALLIERAAPAPQAAPGVGHPDDKTIHGLKPSSVLVPAQVKTLTDPAPVAPPKKPAGFGLFGF